MKTRLVVATLALQLFWVAPALADVTVEGTVTWDVVHAAGGTVTVSGPAIFTQVPIVVDAGGLSGSYSVDLPVGDYGFSASVGDCADAATGATYLCNNNLYIYVFTSTPITGPVAVDISPPPGFGAAEASGTATLAGGSVIGGSASFFWYQGGPDSALYGTANTAVANGGGYAANIGSGEVNLLVQAAQSECTIPQFLTSYAHVESGEHAVLDVLGQALPAAPPPGKIQLTVGVNGYPDVVSQVGVKGTIQPVQDCGGGWNTPRTPSPGALAGTSYLLAGFYEDSPDISPGTYQLLGGFVDPVPGGELRYAYRSQHVTVASQQTSQVDFRIDPAFVKGKWKLDWSQLTGLIYASHTVDAWADLTPGEEVGQSTWTGSWDNLPGAHTYEFKLPIDPNQGWLFGGVTFALYFGDGTFQNIHVVPEVTELQVSARVPSLAAGQTKTYLFGDLMKFGVGQLTFAPTTDTVIAYLNGNSGEVVSGGARGAYLHQSGIWETPSVTGTVMQGRSTLEAFWYDHAFGQHTESLDFDLRATESVTLTESAPRIDELLPLPGKVCDRRISVSGKLSDPDGLASLTVNGKVVTIKRTGGSFKVGVDIPGGASVLTVKAVDMTGKSMVRARPIVFSQNCQ